MAKNAVSFFDKPIGLKMVKRYNGPTLLQMTTCFDPWKMRTLAFISRHRNTKKNFKHSKKWIRQMKTMTTMTMTKHPGQAQSYTFMMTILDETFHTWYA